MNRRSFMKGLAGVVAGVSALSKAEEPQTKKATVDLDTVPNHITKEYDLGTDLVEEMNNFDKKFPDTRIGYSIHCNYTGLAFLNDDGSIDREAYLFEETKLWRYTNLWFPYGLWQRINSNNPCVSGIGIKIILRPNLYQDIGLLAHYSSRRNITNKLENVYTLVTTRCFNVNREEEGKKIAKVGWRPLPKDLPNYRVGDMWTDAEKQQMNKTMTNG